MTAHTVPILTWVLMAASIISILMLNRELLTHAPKPSDPFKAPTITKTYQPKYTPNNCCIATIFNESSIPQVVSLGYSILNTAGSLPKAYALLTSPAHGKELSIVSKYFAIINVSDSRAQFPELNFWSLKTCDSVIAVDHNGVFNRSPSRVCGFPPFSAVSQIADVVYFDPSMMVINPKQPPSANESSPSFAKYINEAFHKWTPLPSDVSVFDFKNEFLDFWTTFNTPTYLHFSAQTFYRAARNETAGAGSKALFDIIQGHVLAAKKEHPAVFSEMTM